MGTTASCIKKRMTSCKATDRSRRSLQFRDLKPYLRRLAKDILDTAVRRVIDEVDRVVFEEEESIVMSE